jgi:hypothetical protein
MKKKSSLISIWTEGVYPNCQILFNETELVSIKTEERSSFTAGNYLAQNFPNPFNCITAIGFNLPVMCENLNLRIYDTSGRLVRTLVDEPFESGYHYVVWDGSDKNDHDVVSGLYIYRIESASYIETRQCIVLR